MNTLCKTLISSAVLCAASTANAGIISFTGSGGVVDSSSSTQSIDVLVGDLAGYQDSILDIDLTVDFSKCGSNATASGCGGTASNFTYNREIVFDLAHLGTYVDIVNQDTFSGQYGDARVTQTYDDEAGTAVGGSILLDGTFNPVGSLSDFDGMSALGLWSFTFQDTVGADPLVVHSWTLDIELAEAAPVPEPATVALLGLGLAGAGFARKRKQS
jgi:hypothetical protein